MVVYSLAAAGDNAFGPRCICRVVRGRAGNAAPRPASKSRSLQWETALRLPAHRPLFKCIAEASVVRVKDAAQAGLLASIYSTLSREIHGGKTALESSIDKVDIDASFVPLPDARILKCKIRIF